MLNSNTFYQLDLLELDMALSAGAVEYTDCVSVER